MVVHLGRLKIVTKRRECACTYKYCSDVVPDNYGRILPGEKVFLLTKMGKIGERTTIFGKYFHMTCFVAWAMWIHKRTPTSKDGRIGMENISPEDKQVRQRLVRQRAQLLRDLRTANTETLGKMTDHIADLDKQIIDTGYPILQYRGRKSDSKTEYDRFWQEVKDRYQHPLRVPGTESEKAARMGMGARFSKDMSEWNDERNRETIERQGKDYEANQEDRELE